jgi:mannosyltransferase OCH1-like enzyme
MIPKIIHQIWIGDQSKRPSKLMQTWSNNHPEWEYRLWTEGQINDFGLFNRKKYDTHPMLSGKADIARYEILFKFGGFFIDADSISIRPMDDLLDNKFIAVYESETYRGSLLANGYFGCVAESRTMFNMINKVRSLDENRMVNRHAWETTGPLPFTKEVSKENVKILSSNAFMPVHFEEQGFSPVNMSAITEEQIDTISKKYSNSYSYQFWGSKSNY